MILILTFPEDNHFLAVESILKDKNVPYILYWYDDFPENSNLSIELNNAQNNVILKTGHTTFNLDDITSVWHRRAGIPVSTNPKKAVKTYIETESRAFLECLSNQMPHAFWVSHPNNIKLADDKLYQLRLASQLGFQIPHTVTGNCSEEVIKAFAHYPEVIVKALHGRYISQDLNLVGRVRKILYNFLNRELVQRYQHHSFLKHYYNYNEKIGIFTQRLSYTELKAFSEQLSTCPVTIQNYIPKRVELRITIVGKQVFPCAIYSQEGSLEDQVDWRHGAENLRHEIYSLPAEIETKCLELMKHLGLEFGCIDMVVTPDNEYVFLEINSHGQWLWVQQKTGMPIAEAIANLLITRQSLQTQPLPVYPA
jgi:glutathione synthase/RimK-type ligase-like ATP-grasp enzyme